MTLNKSLRSLIGLGLSLIMLSIGLVIFRVESIGSPVELRCPSGASLPGGCVALTQAGDTIGLSKRASMQGAARVVDSGVYTDNYGNEYLVVLYDDFTATVGAP